MVHLVSSSERVACLRAARDLMDRRFADPLDLSRLAAHAGFSKFYFVRAFKEAYGETPARYLTRRRVERAKDLLRWANLTVTEVCMLVRFSSLGSFSRRFSELVGMSPSTFQRMSAARGGPVRAVLRHGLGQASPQPTRFTRTAGAHGLRKRHASKRAIADKRRCRVARTVLLAPLPPAHTTGRTGRRTAPAPSAPVLEEEELAMIRAMSHTTVFVLDQESAKAFYTEKLGSRCASTSPWARSRGHWSWLPLAHGRRQGPARSAAHPVLCDRAGHLRQPSNSGRGRWRLVGVA